MSSHHFVKEGQEPALIIANGELCRYSLLVSLLEWNPYVVVLDGAYTTVESLQIKPDVVIGDFDSLTTEIPNQVQTIKLEDQHTTDLEKGINHLIENGYHQITVVGASGKRLDHTINNVMTMAKYPKTKLVFYDDYSKLFVLEKEFSKVYQKGQHISLIPLPKAFGITSTNLRFNLDNQDLMLGEVSGTSNSVSTDGIVSINYQSGLLALIESTDEI